MQSHREQKEAFELLPRLPLQRKSRHLGALEACVQGGSKLGKGCHNSQDYIRTAGLQSAGKPLSYSCSSKETLRLTLRVRLAVFSSTVLVSSPCLPVPTTCLDLKKGLVVDAERR